MSVDARATRKGAVGPLPAPGKGKVHITKTTHDLPYVRTLQDIGNLSKVQNTTVDAWELNNGIVKVKGILLGGNIVSVQKDNKEYIWKNPTPTYSAVDANSFPLYRGLIIYGGVRLAAVSPEHGLYYDTEWDIHFNQAEHESSIIYTIQDTPENRKSVNDRFSVGQFCDPNDPTPMSRYPVTNAYFTFTVTLREGEDFVRLNAALENKSSSPIKSEIWIPQTYPIVQNSRIIAPQEKRRVKDQWVYDTMINGKFASHDMTSDSDMDARYDNKEGHILDYAYESIAKDCTLLKPLEFPTWQGGILYDFPQRTGEYHAVNFGDGRGAAYVSLSNKEKPHYTKVWSWGNPAVFDRAFALKQNPPLAAGRPCTEYYEPWGSRFNTGFFEANMFPTGKHSWDALIVPIESGLEETKSQKELQAKVDEKIAHLKPAIDSLT